MSTPLPAAGASRPTRNELRCLIALLVLAALLRVGVICWKPESLAEDRDLYWGIANQLVTNRTFANPEWGNPTAYRPPLYPILLAGILWVGGGVKLLAVVQVVLGVATTWLTWKLGRKLGLNRSSLVAAAFVALNPLLIQMTAMAMTETLCAFLLVVLMLCVVDRHKSDLRERIGVLFGLTAVCRPTVWAFAVLFAIVSVIGLLLPKAQKSRRSIGSVLRDWLVICIACSVIIVPWGFRNDAIMFEFVVTTTHGGYTLYLGNNDAVYDAEIAHPTDTPWDSRAWQMSVPHPHVGEGADLELVRDRWMTDHAKEWIRQHPREFVELCWLRVKRFWNIMPGGSDAGSFPRVVRWGMAIFFLAELSLAAYGLWRLRRDEWRTWWPLVLLVVSFALVHVVYWSNLRMRAPVEPVLALLAARGLVINPKRERGRALHATLIENQHL